MCNLTVTEFKSIRVLTTQQIAEAYGTDGKIISNNFNRNKDRYKEGKHYICLSGDEKREFLNHHQFDDGLKNASVIYLWTEKGAFLHAKSLGTDKAWEVYENLVDSYFEKKKIMSPEEMMRVQLGMIDGHEERISKLENTMNIDYGQQRVLEKEVSKVVIDALGGKDSNAYREMSKKVFSECNHDIKDYFNVNSRNNIPRLRFDDELEYIRNWQPCSNTRMAIRECNAQMSFGG